MNFGLRGTGGFDRILPMKLTVACCFATALSLSAWAGSEDWTRIYLAENPVVTRDGKSFYFTWNDHIWYAPTAGGTARMVSSAAARQSTPVLSPDGTRLAFLSDCDGGYHLYECPTAGGPVRQLSYHSESTRPWCYTPDGKDLICTAWRDDDGDSDAMRVIRLPATARGPETLLFDLYATAPSLSPDGKQLLFLYGAGS